MEWSSKEIQIKKHLGVRGIVLVVIFLCLGLGFYAVWSVRSRRTSETFSPSTVTPPIVACNTTPTKDGGGGRCYQTCTKDDDCVKTSADLESCKKQAQTLCGDSAVCMNQICGSEKITCTTSGTCSSPNFTVGEDACSGAWVGVCPAAESEVSMANCTAKDLSHCGNGNTDIARTAAIHFCEPWTDEQTGKNWGFYGCCGTFGAANGPKKGSLIKGSSSHVYYYASNGKRYVFPTHFELLSWYGRTDGQKVPIVDPAVCSKVVQIPDAVLGAIGIGGNVTLKPNSYLVGIETDPKRYLISSGRILQAADSMSVIEKIYPGSGEKRILLRPDSIFTNYTIGTSISDPSAYKSQNQTLEQMLGL